MKFWKGSLANVTRLQFSPHWTQFVLRLQRTLLIQMSQSFVNVCLLWSTGISEPLIFAPSLFHVFEVFLTNDFVPFTFVFV